MPRPPSNAKRSTQPAITKLPRPPKSFNADQAEVYRRYGQLLVDAGRLAATDLPMVEAAARVEATLGELYADPDSSRATIAAFERLHKEQMIQLGLTPAARRAVQQLDTPADADADRIRRLLG